MNSNSSRFHARGPAGAPSVLVEGEQGDPAGERLDQEPVPRRRPTLDCWAQDPGFVVVQEAIRARRPEQWERVETALSETARDLTTFSSEDVVDRVDRRTVAPNLIGAVIGSWRAAGRLRVVGREKSRHRAAKGRWVNRFEVTVP